LNTIFTHSNPTLSSISAFHGRITYFPLSVSLSIAPPARCIKASHRAFFLTSNPVLSCPLSAFSRSHPALSLSVPRVHLSMCASQPHSLSLGVHCAYPRYVHHAAALQPRIAYISQCARRVQPHSLSLGVNYAISRCAYHTAALQPRNVYISRCARRVQPLSLRPRANLSFALAPSWSNLSLPSRALVLYDLSPCPLGPSTSLRSRANLSLCVSHPSVCRTVA
ncbi:hypothetical protein C8F04DRAFT_1347601, partial [Mycena alexandri]